MKRLSKRERAEQLKVAVKLISDDMLETAVDEGWSANRLLQAFSSDVTPEFYLNPIEYQVKLINAAGSKLSLAAACKEAGVPYFVGRWWFDNDKDFAHLFRMARDAAVDILESKEYENALEHSNSSGGAILRAYREAYQPQKPTNSQTPVRVRVVFGQGGGAIELTTGEVRDALLGSGEDV